VNAFTPGRFVVSWVGAAGAKDPFALTHQVKVMREGFERQGITPALVLLVVDDSELDTAVEIISTALDTTADAAPKDSPGRVLP
jgi:hypothetical protein